jgi:hypothetical protein
MLRDLRTWHAGMPNESDNYRIMLALGYQVCSMLLPCTEVLVRETNCLVRLETDGAVQVTMVSKPHPALEAATNAG